MRQLFNDGMKAAMKSGEKRKLCTLRLINAAIKDRDILSRTQGQERVSDDGILEILAKMIKQREESARIYEESNRLELSAQEREEIEIIRGYLPKQLGESEVRDACVKAVADVNGASLRDMGKCMSALKERYPGRLDFGKASSVVKEILQ